MKTQKLKNSETLKAINLIVLLMAIFFIEIMVLTNGSRESVKPVFEVMELELMTPIYPGYLPQPITENLENENIFQNKNLREKAIVRETKNNMVNSDKEFSMAKLKFYLNQDVDPVLSLNDALSIEFPENEMMPVSELVDIKNDQQLKELKAMADIKTNEAVENYAFVKKLQEYLVLEKEKPLELETWMTDEKCWCPEMVKPLNLAELYKVPQ
jgi:hypothetical protein